MKQKRLEQLKIFYLFIFVLGAVIILPTHIFPQPYLMPLRFPHYLEMMKPFLGISWPMSFEIYHYTLYALATIASFNVLGILFYPRLRKTAITSSLIGIFLLSLFILFFFFKFINVNAPTAIIYGLYSVILLIVDALTFKFLTKKQKEEAREAF